MALRPRLGAGERPHHPHLGRFSQGRSVARLRIHGRANACHRCTRERWDRVRASVCARPPDLAGPCLTPVRPPAVPNRRPEQPRLQHQGQRAPPGRDAARSRLRNRWRGVVLRSPGRHRRVAGVRVLRRQRRRTAFVGTTGPIRSAARTRRYGLGAHRRAVARVCRNGTGVPVSAPVPSRTHPTSPPIGSRSSQPTTARSCTWTRSWAGW